jgi:hypothetical protein
MATAATRGRHEPTGRVGQPSQPACRRRVRSVQEFLMAASIPSGRSIAKVAVLAAALGLFGAPALHAQQVDEDGMPVAAPPVSARPPVRAQPYVPNVYRPPAPAPAPRVRGGTGNYEVPRGGTSFEQSISGTRDATDDGPSFAQSIAGGAAAADDGSSFARRLERVDAAPPPTGASAGPATTTAALSPGAGEPASPSSPPAPGEAERPAPQPSAVAGQTVAEAPGGARQGVAPPVRGWLASWGLFVALAVLGATGVALLTAKLLMPWPRPRLRCGYEIGQPAVGEGGLTLHAPDLAVRAEATFGVPAIVGALTVQRGDRRDV